MNLSIENVKRSGGPFAARIAKDGKIIDTGVNRVAKTNDPTAHAEITAIHKAGHHVVRKRDSGVRNRKNKEIVNRKVYRFKGILIWKRVY